jgi:hypothetical protein
VLDVAAFEHPNGTHHVAPADFNLVGRRAI